MNQNNTDITHNKRRITITVDNAVFDKLPKRDRSAHINLIIKNHYQKESADQLYEYFKKRLLKDKDINEWIVITARELR